MRTFTKVLTAAVLALAPLAGAVAADMTPVFVGKKYNVSYMGGPSLRLEFKSATALEGTFLAGPSKGQVLKITYTAKEVAPSVYMLTWQEADKTTVTHVDDFSRMVSYSNVTLPDGTFMNMVGRLANTN
jgi:hypothetical protein